MHMSVGYALDALHNKKLCAVIQNWLYPSAACDDYEFHVRGQSVGACALFFRNEFCAGRLIQDQNGADCVMVNSLYISLDERCLPA